MDTLLMVKEIIMQWNLMDVGITDVLDVIPMIEIYYRSWERSMQQRYMETLKKKKVLQQLGLTVHEMWYCDYKLYHESNNLKVVKEPLRIQDAYFGGRTNAINLKEFSNETKGGYVDFCSLYPHVLKYEDYPVGHPIHINGNFNSPITSFAYTEKPCPVLGTEDCNGMHLKLKYFGLIKAKILPPCGLLLPIFTNKNKQ